MRITNNYMTRNYLGNLNNALDLYNQSGEKIHSGRKLNKMSDNVSEIDKFLKTDSQFKEHCLYVHSPIRTNRYRKT